jgi:hypothetical protein
VSKSFDFRRILEAKITLQSQPKISDEFLALLSGAIKRMGPVEKVRFSLADSFDKPGEFDDRLLSDWCFSTGPYGFLKIDARVRTGG